MQQLTAGPRENLTAEQVRALIRDAPAIQVGRGLELLDMALGVVEDISADFQDGSVSRNGYATLHGTASLAITRELDWGRALVRPYIILTDGTTTARFNEGAYFTSTPGFAPETQPVIHQVDGYDILHALSMPTGTSYALDAGTSYLAAVATILADQGYRRFAIEQTAAAATLPDARVWLLDDNPTWLTIVNDLLDSVGYQGIWSDWDGQLRCEPYQRPRDRSPEWVYDTGENTSMVGPGRALKQDFFEAPNRWVFVRGGAPDGPAPVEGDGIFTFTNIREGPTSVEARGRVITAQTRTIDVVDHDSLMAAAMRQIDADLRLKETVELVTSPNPLHWHFDRVRLEDPGLGTPKECLVTQWTLPLSGGDMSHEWSVVL